MTLDLYPEFEEKDSRRIDLTMKRERYGLTPEETAELDALNDWVTSEIYRVYPDEQHASKMSQELQKALTMAKEFFKRKNAGC